MLLGDEEGVVKAITHLPPEAGTMGGDPASNLYVHVSSNVRFHYWLSVSKNLRLLPKPEKAKYFFLTETLPTFM